MVRLKEGEPIRARAFRIGSVVSLVAAHGLTACGLNKPKETPIPEVTETPAAATFTPEPSPTTTRTHTPTLSPTPTETPIPTPDLETIDSNNQILLEQVRGGEIIDLPYPQITSFMRFPWFAEEDEPKEAVIALVWGENWPSGVVTSADCLYDFYRERNGLEEQLVPLLKFFPTKESVERVVNLNAQNSQLPFPIIDAKGIDIFDSEIGNTKFQKCEQVKELDRLQNFLANIDWKDLTRLSARELGKFAISFLKGLEEAGINVPFFP